jgi:hypothetical protein
VECPLPTHNGHFGPPRFKNGIAAISASDVYTPKLLGVNSGSIEWRYLNSGVHDAEIDHEFDRSTVRTIVEALVQLDQSIEELQNRRV